MTRRMMAVLAAALLLVFLLPQLAARFRPVQVNVDGSLLDDELVSTCYINDEDRLMVPLTALPQMLGAVTEVDQEGRIALAWPSRGHREEVVAHMELDSRELKWGDSRVTMDCTPVRQDGTVYVPLVWAAEPAQIPINWDAATKTVRLLTGKPVKHPDSSSDAGRPESNAAFDTQGIECVPILMYHQVCEPPSSGDTNLFLSPRLFAQQLDYLQDAGYTTITMQQLYDAWNDGAPLPARPVILTFDDGYVEMYENALPELEKHGMTGTFFVIAGCLDQPGSVSSAQVREMHDKGMEIASHSYYHSSLPSADLEVDLKKSREVLEDVTGAEIRFLCYPYGEYDDRVIEKAREYGYLMAVTTKQGTASKEQGFFALKRLRINCGDGPGRLKSLLGS